MLLSVTYLLVCFVIHFLSPAISIRYVPHFQAKIVHAQRLSWYNRIVSSLHALVMSSLAIYYWLFINDRKIMYSDIGDYASSCADLMIGYLIYDIVYEIMFTKDYDTLLHHLLGLVVHLLTRYTNSGISMYYLMIVYLAELSTPLLHFTWLLFQLQHEQTRLFQISQWSLVGVFFFCRICLSTSMLGHIVLNKQLWRNQEIAFYMNSIVCMLFVVLNLKWFKSLVGLALRSLRPKEKAGK
jgi:hypothetical protein